MPRARNRKPALAAMEQTGDGVRAWRYLRRVEDYRVAWQAQTALPAPEPLFEPGPFPIRIQTPPDLDAARFDLLAWKSPYDTDGIASPFWIQEGMVEAVLEPPEAKPLVPLVVAAGGAIEGLRLMDGDLVLKIEYAGAVVQVRLRDAASFPDDGGIEIRHRFGLQMPQSVRQMLDFWSVAGLPVPRKGGARGERIAHL